MGRIGICLLYTSYADYNHEVMTGFLIEEAWKKGKEVAVPKVVGKDMVFYKLTDWKQLEPGYFGIPEPAYGEIVEWEDAVMIMPGVAFDNNCHRVGSVSYTHLSIILRLSSRSIR